MSKAGKRLLAAAREMQAIARGEAEPARTHPAPSSYALTQALYAETGCALHSRKRRPPPPTCGAGGNGQRGRALEGGGGPFQARPHARHDNARSPSPSNINPAKRAPI